MKALTIKFTHGRIWTAETSDGKRATGASLVSVLDQLVPLEGKNGVWVGIETVFKSIRDDGSDGQIARGRASA